MKQDVERFQMRVGGEIWPVSINHTHKAVKIQDVVYKTEAWHHMTTLAPVEARAAHRAAQKLEGEIV